MKDAMGMYALKLSMWARDEKTITALLVVSALAILAINPAMASGEALPWEAPLQKVMASLCGPVAKFSAVIAFVVTGLLVAFGEMKGVFGVMLRVVFGLSIALLATQWLGALEIGDGIGVTC